MLRAVARYVTRYEEGERYEPLVVISRVCGLVWSVILAGEFAPLGEDAQQLGKAIDGAELVGELCVVRATAF